VFLFFYRCINKLIYLEKRRSKSRVVPGGFSWAENHTRRRRNWQR